MADDLDSRFDKALSTPTGDSSLDSRFDRAISFPGSSSVKKASLDSVTGTDLADLGLKSIPFLAGTAGGLATGGLGLVPAVGAAMLTGAGGAAVEQGVRAGTGINPPKDLNDFTSKVGWSALESGGAEIGGRAVLGAFNKVFGSYFDKTRLYQSGLKPSGSDERNAIKSVEAGISGNIPLDPEKSPGLVRSGINKLNDAVERIISSAPADIPPARYVANVQSKLDVMRKEWAKDATKGKAFVDQIDEMERQFLINHGDVQPIQKVVYNPQLGNTPATQRQLVTIEPEDMSLVELRQNARPLATGDAQKIKKQTYETIRTSKQNAYEIGSHPGVTIEGSQTIARALKEELENVYPQIKGLNRTEGGLIELEKQLQRFVKREFNKQATPYAIFPIAGAMLGAGHGAEGVGVGGSLGALAGHMTRRMLEDPGIKSRLAILLDQAARNPGGWQGNTIKGIKQLPAGVIRLGEYLNDNKK